MSEVLFQSATGTARLTALLLFLGALTSVVLSALVIARGIQGYRRTRDPGLVALSLGIALLTGGAVAANVALTNATAVSQAVVTTAVNCVRLAGLLTVLAAIYGTGGRRDGSGPPREESARRGWVPLLAVPWSGLAAGTAVATAALGTLVAYQSYRGYRRNDSRPMAWLALGILLVTALPVVAEQSVALLPVTGATGALAGTALRLAGLLVVLAATTRR